MAANLQLVITAVDKATGVLSDVGDKAGKSGGLMGTAFKLGALGAAAGIGVAALASVKFVNAAADLNESINKANVVFGNSIGVIENFADTSAKSFGISKNAAFSYAGTLGTILKGSGLTEDASADMSTKLLTLAADMASFNNIPIDQALEKIRSGLVGESEPLRTVGVLLSEAAVKQEAYASGIAVAGSELTDAQKVQARYSLILKQTSDQQGDFARTSDSLANKSRVLGASWENIQAILGQVLLPVVEKATKALSDFLTENEDDIQRLSLAFQKWVDEALPKVQAFVESDVIPTLVDAFKQLKQLIEDISPHVEKFANFLSENKEVALVLAVGLGILAAVLLPLPLAILPIIGEIVEAVFSFVKARVEFWITAAKAVIDIVMGLITGDWDRAWNGIKDLANGILNLFKADVETALNLIKGVFGDIMAGAKDAAINAISGLPGAIVGVISDAWGRVSGWKDNFFNTGKRLMEELARGIKAGIGVIGDAIQSVIDKVNPLNWDVFGGSPFLTAFRHAGQKATKALAQGLDSMSQITMPLNVLAAGGTAADMTGVNSRLDQVVTAIRTASDAIVHALTWVIARQDVSNAFASWIPIGTRVLENMYAVLSQMRGSMGLSPLSFQHGGYVPAGAVTRALLHGPEFVIPANRMGGMGSNINFNVTINGVMSQAQAEREGRRLADATRRYMRHSG